MAYPQVSHTGDESVPSSPSFPQIEEAVLAYWADDDTFRASVAQRDAGEDGANEFVFYDGPPFANGLPHYGHLLTGYVKDLVPRFQTMRGRRVERRFGWDTHGLPAELEAMRQLGMKTTEEILELGIEKFNAECRKSVFEYTSEWRDYVTRQARWVDFDNDYKTLDLPYMESVMWAFKQLHDKGLAYEGFRVLPYCWNDETPLSNHELRMDEDVYQQRVDPAVTVGLRLTSGPAEGALALIWTTTPWTLAANLAVMVGRDIDYVVVESDFTGTTERYLLAEARLAAYAKELGESPEVLQRFRGVDLLESTYTPPMSYYLGHERAFRVVEADIVTTEDGTGLVHTAGAFGEEDKVVTDREGIEPVVPVAKDGTFTPPVDDYAGLHVFEANLAIIDHLRAMTRGAGDTGSITEGTVLLRRESYEHSYPHCWRCREPLIYMAVSSWFVSTTKIRDRMLDLNQQIRWVPDHVKDGQFGRWLENTRDWSISRNRFWGSPIPVWRSDDPAYPRVDVYGSLDELERDFGVRPDDLHRPFIDQLTRPNPDDPTGSLDDAPGHRRHGLLVRVRVDELRPGALPVREHRLVRAPLPGRLHRRVHRPDAWLVLHDARARERDLRAARVRDLPEPRHRARLRRPEDEQVAAQLPRRARGLRPRRRRRDALVPDVQPDPARRQPDRHRAQHPRGRPPGADPAVELLVLLRAVRERRRLHRAATDRLGRPAGPLPAGQDPPVRRRHDRVSSTTTRSPTRATRRGRSSTCSPTGTSAAPASASGRPTATWTRRRSTRSTPSSRRSRGARRRCCR